MAAHAGTVFLGGPVLPGGAMIASVRSLQALKFRGIVRQHTDYSCGAAALATILDYAYGQHQTERQVILGMLRVSNPGVVRERGFSMLDMARYLSHEGLHGAGYRVPMQRLTALRIPAIALLDIHGYQHFVVLKGVVGGRAYLADPALGNRSVSLARFKKDWDGVLFLVIGPHYDTHTVLRSRMSVRRVHGVMSALRQGEERHLADFGFISTTLF